MSQRDVEALLITGSVSSGKTTLLARRAAALAARGGDVLVVAACPGGLTEISRQLARLGAGDAVHTTSAARLASELLALPGAARRIGYEARLITPAEDKMLFEDLKTSGIKQERLREMTGFFERTYNDLGEQADDFPFEWEETGMMAYQQDYLKAYGVTTLERATCAIFRCLKADGALARRAGCAHVLVDDYQLLGRAMQRICCLLAETSIAITCGAEPATPVSFRFPNESGADEFVELFPNAQVTRLETSFTSKGAAAALNVLRADEGMGLSPLVCACKAGAGAGERVEFATPAAELEGIVRILQRAHERGIAWNDMAVSGASELWLANVAACLRRAGMPLAFMPSAEALPVGFKSEKRNDAARLASMLALAARPDDGMAWRTWCGFGSYTGNSATFMRVRRAALDDGRSIRRVLEGMRAGEYPDIVALGDAADVLRALDEAEFALERLDGLRGAELLNQAARLSQVISEKPAAQIRRLLSCAKAGGAGGDEDAPQLLELLNQALLEPAPSSTDGVRICLPEAMAGAKFRMVVFCGAVNGVVPAAKYFDPAQIEDDKRKRMRRKDMARLHAALSRATEELYVTSFKDIALEQAERLGIEAERIRAERGVRVASASPSVLLAGIALRSEKR